MKIMKMKISHYNEVYSLWEETEGMGLHSDVDSKKGIARYLKQNPGMSFVARENGKLIGTVMCGQDGRRGYLFHLAVDKNSRKKGIGKAIVNKALTKLAQIGISKCLIFVYANNLSGQKFWKHTGWKPRPDVFMMSKDIGKISGCC